MEFKACRKALGLTQRQLAAELGSHHNTVARWERGALPVPDHVRRCLLDLVAGSTAREVPLGPARSRRALADPLFHQITVALDGDLDPEVFEDAATALLSKKEFPGIAPVRGGSDEGFDGAIPDAAGEPLPLICTTGRNAIRNLTRSVQRYLDRGHPKREAVFATSRRITPQTRFKLIESARKLGFALRQVYDQAWFAEELYRESGWRKRLLGLAGTPCALRLFPSSRRPMVQSSLVGRTTDLEWLRNTPGDLLLVGVPGSGKTALLRSLALDGEGLFAIDTDRRELANALRGIRPKRVFVDDAHVSEGVVALLRDLRIEIDADFGIIATSWPGDRDGLMNVLQVTNQSVRELRPLSRDVIVEVVRGAGLDGPDFVVREIVDQAEGRPGLAVTLAWLWLNGDAEAAYGGDGLLRSLSSELRRLGGDESLILLGVLALGGRSGMRVVDVAPLLRESELRVRTLLASLDWAGVVREAGDGVIMVSPESLRWVLVREVFFGRHRLPYDRFVAFVPSMAELARVLCGARGRGAAIPDGDIIAILEKAESSEAWAVFASLGESQAEWVLENHPGVLLSVAMVALERAPSKCVPLLLEKAVGDSRALHSCTNHPLRIVQDWVDRARPGRGEAVPRRRLALDAAVRWLRAGRDVAVGLHLLSIALSPDFEATSTDPGRGTTITISRGLLTRSELEEITGLWPTAFEMVEAIAEPDWLRIIQLVEGWASPRLLGAADVPPALADVMRNFVQRALADVAAATRNRPGMQHRIQKAAGAQAIQIDVLLDADFEILFPEWSAGEWKEEAERTAAAARGLGQAWSERNPRDVISRVVELEGEARASGVSHPRETGKVIGAIATACASPIDWALAAIAQCAPSDVVSQFVLSERLGTAGEVSQVVEALLRSEDYRHLGVFAGLSSPAVTAGVRELALDHAPRFVPLIETACLRRELPVDIVARLMTHDDAAVALAAAVGEWNADGGTVREELREQWRAAILSAGQPEFWLGEILAGDPDLALGWLLRRLDDSEFEVSCEYRQVALRALSSLDLERRVQLLPHLAWRSGLGEVVTALVDGEVSVYTQLVEQTDDVDIRLAPLEGRPVGHWGDLAAVAVAAGIDERSVASAPMQHWSWSGSEAEMWAGFAAQFRALEADPRPVVARVASKGREIAEGHEKRARDEDQTRAIYGHF